MTQLTAFRNSTHLGVKIRAPSVPVAKPINLALLVDTSGSMEGERLDAVKRTLHAARGLFCPDDQLTMVTFDDGATVIADHLRMDLQQFYAAVDNVQAKGSTNLSAGIEKLLVLQKEPYDAIMVLTDGHINRGIVSMVGLRSMMFGVGHFPITAIGYGADHNRVLLRHLATSSRGAYVFVDSESILPVALGDMIGGLRTELYKDAILRVPDGWVCCENDGVDASYRLGNIVPDRDYWVVFEKCNDTECSSITLTAGVSVIAETDRIMVSDCQDLHEQVLRCRVAKAIVVASDLMEQMRPIGPEIAALVEEFKALPESMLNRPLVLRMQAQLVEILDAGPSGPTAALLARMSSGGAYLSTQRGVSCVSDPQCHTFSSPSQRAASQHVQTQSVQ